MVADKKSWEIMILIVEVMKDWLKMINFAKADI